MGKIWILGIKGVESSTRTEDKVSFITVGSPLLWKLKKRWFNGRTCCTKGGHKKYGYLLDKETNPREKSGCGTSSTEKLRSSLDLGLHRKSKHRSRVGD